MSTEVAIPEVERGIATVSDALSVAELVSQVQLIQEAMQAAMKDGEHYGVIPGTKKPTLLKPGAEKLCLLFRLDPEYPPEQVKEVWHPDGHYTVTAICTLFHILTGNRIASGLGLCSTREEKYAYRNAERVCPDCGVAAIVRSQNKSAFFCIRDKGGCGHRFAFGTEQATALEGQDAGKKPNENLPDTYNTVLKMACKRALVAAVLNGTAASDIFTQDMDDRDEPLSEPEPQSSRSQPSGDVSQGSAEEPSGSENSEARKTAIGTLSSALKHAREHGSLPPGHDSWDDYLKWHIEGRYNLLGAEGWREKLTPEQMQEMAAYLLEQDIPL